MKWCMIQIQISPEQVHMSISDDTVIITQV